MGQRAVRDVMGMPVTIDVRDEVDAAGVEAAYAELEMVDRIFSPFRPDSEVSRIDRGELRPEDSSAVVREVLDLCRHYQRATGGHFNAWVGGHLDPSGLVKGWAIERACRILERCGCRNYALDAGGDVMARGQNGSGGPWRVGIRHPVERNLVARVVLASDLAVATSGTYEKGAHIVDGVTERPAGELVSLTVVGPDIVEADVFATAAFAAGEGGLQLIEGLRGYEAYAIWPDLRAAWTPGLEALWA